MRSPETGHAHHGTRRRRLDAAGCIVSRIPDPLTSIEVNAIRAAITRWEAGDVHALGPRPDRQLGAIVEVMLGASARIGEVLAIRRRASTTPAPSQSSASPDDRSREDVLTFQQDHPTTSKSSHIVALPTLTPKAVRRSLAIAPVGAG